MKGICALFWAVFIHLDSGKPRRDFSWRNEEFQQRFDAKKGIITFRVRLKTEKKPLSSRRTCFCFFPSIAILMNSSKLTIDQLRSQILGIDTTVPLLNGERVRYVFLDNGASTPSFKRVMDVLNEFMPYYSSVHRGAGYKSLLSTKVYDEAREIVAEFVRANPETNTVLFGKNTTELINKVANRCGWREDDVVLSTMMEHHSNDLPWRRHAKVVHIGVDKNGWLDMNQLREAFNVFRNRVRFLTVTGASNITGIVNPIHELAEIAHAHGAMIFVDAAQLAPHRRIDVLPESDPGHIDFLAFSAHKMYAPFGIGALVGPVDWFSQGDPDIVGGGVVEIVEQDFVAYSGPPAKEEAGTPNLPGVVALATAIKILEEVGMDAITQHEQELLEYTIPRMTALQGITLFGPKDPEELANKVGVLSFTVDGMPHEKVSGILSAEGGIGVRNGCFCAHIYVKHLLGVNHEEEQALKEQIMSGNKTHIPGMVRASFGCYNNREDVDRFITLLERIVKGDYHGEYELDPHTGMYWPKNFSYDFANDFPHFSFSTNTQAFDLTEAS